MRQILKNTIWLTVFTVLTYASNGQDLKVSVAPTWNSAFYYRFVTGGPSREAKSGMNASIEYMRPLSEMVKYGFGVGYQFCTVGIIPAPFSESSPHTESLSLVSACVKIEFHFRKEYFLSVDPFIGYQPDYNSWQTIDNQTGLGLSIGFGKQIPVFKSGFIEIEPKLWVYNIVPFADINLPMRLTIFGLKAGFILCHSKNR